MSTIRRKFFPDAVPARPAASAGLGIDDARPICLECIAHAQCVFAEHLNKGIFFAKHLRIAHGIFSHRRAMTMSKWSDNRCFGIHEPPTIGSRFRHRTSRFAQKLRKLFPPRDRHRGRSQCVRQRFRMSYREMRRRVSYLRAWRGQPIRTLTSPACRGPGRYRNTGAPIPAQERRCRRGATRPASFVCR